MSSARITNVAVIALAVMLIDWGSKLWSQQSIFVVFNDREASWWPVPLLFACTAFFLWVSRDWLTTFALGLLTGGWLANFIDRMFFGPVTDFIPISVLGRQYYANLADVAIVASLPLILIVVARSFRILRRWEERRRARRRARGDRSRAACEPRTSGEA